jgi:formylglycine-generating enzyme required for sulfatase activity
MSTRYSWGDDIGHDNANCDGCGSLWDDDQTAPVGSFWPNALGLYDIHGNVSEWVEDCWHDSYVDAPSDGSARVSGDCSLRVVRGGSWYYGPSYVRSAGRTTIDPALWFGFNGFRVARTLD